MISLTSMRKLCNMFEWNLPEGKNPIDVYCLCVKVSKITREYFTPKKDSSVFIINQISSTNRCRTHWQLTSLKLIKNNTDKVLEHCPDCILLTFNTPLLAGKFCIRLQIIDTLIKVICKQRHAACRIDIGICLGMQHRHAASIFDFIISKSEKKSPTCFGIMVIKSKFKL